MLMRWVHATLLLAVSASPAFAQREPEIVIPGKPGVPIYINGIDASWSVVEGEFGLDRPGAATPTVIYRPLVVSIPYAVPGYFPSDNRRPGYGRLEVEPPPNRSLPPPAPGFSQSWSSRSAPGPVSEYAPFGVPPAALAPRFGRNHPRPSGGMSNPYVTSPGNKGPNQKSP
jgi:hypothetical protein